MRGRLCALLLRLHVLPALNDLALDGARIEAGDTVADVGAGEGLTQGALERVGPDGDVLAIDTSVDVLEELRATTAAPNVSYLIGRADVLPLMDESVDAALARAVLIRAQDESEAARELFRVLRSGGRVSVYGDPDEDDLGQVFTSAGFSEVRTAPGVCVTAVKP